MPVKPLTTLVLAGVMVMSLAATARAQSDENIQQSVEEYERLMPITGTVKTLFRVKARPHDGAAYGRSP